jgi:hypothetical protein
MRLAALVLALAALLGPAAATAIEDTFAARVYVVGRVVDDHDLPAPALPVNVTFSWLASTPPPCILDDRAAVTDARGDYEACFAVGAVPDGGTVTVQARGASGARAVDPSMREANVSLRLGVDRSARDVLGDRAFNASLRVHVRLMRALLLMQDVQGVEVNASPVTGENVTATLAEDDGVVAARATNVTDDMGHADLDLAVGSAPPGARVTVSALGQDWTAPVQSEERRADALLLYGDLPTSAPRPGGSVAAVGPLGAVLALVIVALGKRGWGR